MKMPKAELGTATLRFQCMLWEPLRAYRHPYVVSLINFATSGFLQDYFIVVPSVWQKWLGSPEFTVHALAYIERDKCMWYKGKVLHKVVQILRSSFFYSYLLPPLLFRNKDYLHMGIASRQIPKLPLSLSLSPTLSFSLFLSFSLSFSLLSECSFCIACSTHSAFSAHNACSVLSPTNW